MDDPKLATLFAEAAQRVDALLRALRSRGSPFVPYFDRIATCLEAKDAEGAQRAREAIPYPNMGGYLDYVSTDPEIEKLDGIAMKALGALKVHSRYCVYDEPAVLTEYVCDHCGPQMTDLERAGLKALHARAKAESADSVRIRDMILRQWSGQSSPEVVAALSGGEEAFRVAVRDRVLRDHPELINRCPKCKRVARTPRAKQCRWCFHDWHHQ